jgi:hypothetical protein
MVPSVSAEGGNAPQRTQCHDNHVLPASVLSRRKKAEFTGE